MLTDLLRLVAELQVDAMVARTVSLEAVPAGVVALSMAGVRGKTVLVW